MQKNSIYITRQISPQAIRRLEDQDVRVWSEDRPAPYSEILAQVAGIQGLICLLTDTIDANLIQNGSHLKVISQMAVGYDNIDIAYATRQGIPVGHTPGVLTETCADFAFGLILTIARRIAESDRQVRSNIWKPWGPEVLIGQEVHGSTLGLVGFGRIGQAVARRAAGFSMPVLFYDPQPDLEAARRLEAKPVEFDELLLCSDFVSIHSVLNRQTHHLFNRARFQQMKRTAYLVNTSRGGLIDPDALLWALEHQVIQGAAIDVFEPEPIPRDHPLLSLDRVVITPHIASASIQTREKMALMAVENLLAGLEGQRLPHCANPEVYTKGSPR